MTPSPYSVSALKEHIVAIRGNVCPRTSYATSGSAASVVYALVSTKMHEQFGALSDLLKNSDEFDEVKVVDSIEKLKACASGNVIVVFGDVTQQIVEEIESIFAVRKTKLAVLVDFIPDMKALSSVVSDREFSKLEQSFQDCQVISCYGYRIRKKVNTAGFNQQPSVQSRNQFRYLWQTSTTTSMDYGKERVLQRLSDKPIHGQKGLKYSTAEWDSRIQGALNKGLDDYEIYNLIRKLVLGTSIAQDLEKQIEQGMSSAIANSTSSQGGDTNATDTKLSAVGTSDGGDEDGRANHMVSRTMESIPLRLRTAAGHTTGHSGGAAAGGGVQYLLDYGCAEGAITAALGKQLGLPPSRIIGADVRTIPADGFTFLPLAAEAEEEDIGEGATTTGTGSLGGGVGNSNAPKLGSILPKLRDASIDLITSAMVFHHVTHIHSVLLELRRVISPKGALVIREHHCTSADMGAFLDITHGLYSLSWSQPIEWPDFLDEYEAFYRSREEWTQLAAACGWSLADVAAECGRGGERSYHAAEYAKRKPDGFFPNVIKAYYAVYFPTPGFQFPAHALSRGGSSSSSSNKRSATSSGNEVNDPSKRTKVVSQSSKNIDTIHSSSSSSSSATATAAQQQQQQQQQQRKKVDAEGNVLYESKKYPGRYYRLHKVTGAAEWIS